MTVIKGPFKLHGSGSLSDSLRKIRDQENQIIKLPFEASGWKSSKQPAGITTKDIEKGESKRRR